MIQRFPGFLAVAALVIVTPGPDTALTIRNTLLAGRRGGIFTAVGVSTGQAIWAVSASLGVAALLRASEPAFVVLRVLGATYLMFLGGQALLGALRRSHREAPEDPHFNAAVRRPETALRQGVISNLGNPKMAVFFTGLLPQFTSDDAAFVPMVLLGLLFCCMTLVWLTGYAFVVSSAGDFLRRTGVRRALEGTTGGVLIGLGLRLAVERR